MDHQYPAEQEAYHGGLLDKFVEFTGSTDPGCTDFYHKKLVMGYYDGNTVTALWNYAQHFAMNDDSFGTTFGPSTPGAINLVSGNTHGTMPVNQHDDEGKPWGIVNGTVIGDIDPKVDDCSRKGVARMQMIGQNMGDLLNAKNLTWGWFQGGFRPTERSAEGNAICGSSHKNINGTNEVDYVPHHEPFMYYNSTYVLQLQPLL
jgi:phospholipase C